MANPWDNDPIVGKSDAQPNTSVMGAGTPYSPGAETARSALGALTFGFGDEIEAGIRSALGLGDYKSIRDDLRVKQGAFEQNYPGTKLLTEMGVGMVPGFAAAKIPAARAAMIGNTPVETLKRGAALGAGSGALSGAGAAPELSDVPVTAGISGAVGGVVGGAAPVVVGELANAGRNLLQSVGIGSAERFADRKILESLRREGMTAEQAGQELARLRAIGIPDSTLADLGSNPRRLGYSAYIVPSDQKTATEALLTGRQEAAREVLGKSAQTTAGLGGSLMGNDFLKSLADRQRAAANATYPNAMRLDLDARPFRDFVNRDVISEAWARAQRIANIEEGIRLPDFEQVKNAQSIPTKYLQQVKIGLDDMIAGKTNQITGKVEGKEGAALVKLKKDFDERIRTLNPDYAKANDEFADFARLKNSFESGEKYMGFDESILLEKLRKMNPAEKEAFRVGMVSKIQDALQTAKTTDPTSVIFKSPKQKSLIRYAFEDEAGYKNFISQINAVGEQFKTGKRILGGSTTAENAALVGEAGRGADALALAMDAISGNMRSAANRVTSKLGGVSENVSSALQQRLLNADPAAQQKIIADLIAEETARKRFGTLKTPGAYSAGIGGVMGGLLY